MGLSRRAYARHRGVAENAVRKALATGRITLEPDGTIDPAKADAAWQTLSDPAQVHERKPVAREQLARAKAPDAKPVPAAAVEAVRETLRESGEAPAAGGMTFVQARTANEVMKAQERRVRLQKLKGDLVDRARAVETIFSAARRERDAWVQWPARVAALMAAELRVDAHEMETVLDKYVRRHLAELSDVRIELR